MSNMFIYNATKGDSRENIIIKSLKMDPKDDDLVVGPGQFISTEEYGIPERRVDQSFELKTLVSAGKLVISREPLHLQQAQSPEQQAQITNQEENQVKLDNIASSTNLSELEDIIDHSDDIKLVKEAAKRLRDLLDEEGIDIPETEGKPNNPIV